MSTDQTPNTAGLDRPWRAFGTWIAIEVYSCACAGGTEESSYQHEHHCGYEPIFQSTTEAELIAVAHNEVVARLRAELAITAEQRDAEHAALLARREINRVDGEAWSLSLRRAEAERDDLAARLERAETVVEAAEAWLNERSDIVRRHDELRAAVDAYRAGQSTPTQALDKSSG